MGVMGQFRLLGCIQQCIRQITATCWIIIVGVLLHILVEGLALASKLDRIVTSTRAGIVINRIGFEFALSQSERMRYSSGRYSSQEALLQVHALHSLVSHRLRLVRRTETGYRKLYALLKRANVCQWTQSFTH